MHGHNGIEAKAEIVKHGLRKWGHASIYNDALVDIPTPEVGSEAVAAELLPVQAWSPLEVPESQDAWHKYSIYLNTDGRRHQQNSSFYERWSSIFAMNSTSVWVATQCVCGGHRYHIPRLLESITLPCQRYYTRQDWTCVQTTAHRPCKWIRLCTEKLWACHKNFLIIMFLLIFTWSHSYVYLPGNVTQSQWCELYVLPCCDRPGGSKIGLVRLTDTCTRIRGCVR